MGMRYKLCLSCGKKRRKAEDSKTKPEKRWKYIPAIGLVCFVCAEGKLKYVR